METKQKGNWLRNSTSLKMAIIVIISLLLLIPLTMIKNLIEERKKRNTQTITEVSNKWGKEQTLKGPVLVVPYSRQYKDKEGKVGFKKGNFNILPTELDIEGNLSPEVRYRGIYKVISYKANILVKGSYSKEDLTEIAQATDEVFWDKAHLAFGLSDLRGITDEVDLLWNSSKTRMKPGNGNSPIFTSGINSLINFDPNQNNILSANLKFRGSKSLFFMPAGKTTRVNISSSWSSPSFDGDFLPEREINDSGFKAKWTVLEMNRSYPQVWENNKFNEHSNLNTFGVNLFSPVDQYQKVMRSVKYALLFIGLTFLVIFFSEITGKSKVHPIQYLITGFSLILFFSLLLALSEHMSFNLSYLIASLTIALLNAYYFSTIFLNKKYTIIATSLIVALYIFLFTILQISDYSLLLGNIGLVLVIGSVMIISRKINWYAIGKTDDATE